MIGRCSKYAAGEIHRSLYSISCTVPNSQSQDFCDICAADFIQMILILNKLELVEPNLREEAMFRVCTLPARVRLSLFADSLCSRKNQEKMGWVWGRERSHMN